MLNPLKHLKVDYIHQWHREIRHPFSSKMPIAKILSTSTQQTSNRMIRLTNLLQYNQELEIWILTTNEEADYLNISAGLIFSEQNGREVP